MRIYRSLFKSSYLKNKKHFLSFLFHLRNLHQISNIFIKKKIVIANVFPKLATVQGLATPLTIQRRLKTSCDSQHVKQYQTLVKPSWEHFYHIFSSLWGEIIWKISPWFKFEIIGFLLTHWLLITSILYGIVRICRSLFKSSSLKNKKHFLAFFFHWWNLHQISNIFIKKKIVIANVFPKLATVQGLATPLTIQRRLKTSFDTQHVKRYQTLVKSSWEHFYHIFPSLWGEIIWKISPWLKFEIIGFFLTHGLSITSILFRIVRIWCSLFKSSYLKNKKHFLVFLFHLWNLHQILNNFKKKNIVIANVFPKLATVQGLVTPLTIQRRLKTSFESHHLKRYQTLVKSSWVHFYHIFSSLWGEIIWKISPWLKFEIIGFLLTHGLLITSILFGIVRILRSLFKSSSLKNKKHFLGFLFHLWNLHQIWNILQKKKIVIANVFPKLATVEGLVTPLTNQHRLKTSCDSQHVKQYQTLVKPSWEYFYHIFSSLWGEIIWKISPWFKFEIIGFLLTHGLSITSILFRIVRICRSLFKSSSLKNKKHFLGVLFHLWHLHQISNIFKKKKTVIANVFPKLATVEGLVTPLTIQRRLKTSFDSQQVKGYQTLVKSSWVHFYHIFSSLWGERIWKTSPWLKFEIIGFLLTHGLLITCILFRIVRIFRSLFNSSSLKNKKHFPGFLFHLWNLHQISNILQKKKIVIANVFPKLATVEDSVTPLTIQRRLKTSFDSQHVKQYQTLVKPSWEYFYHIFSSLWGEIIWKISPWFKFEIIGFLLTHGLSITSILFRIVRICRSLFKSSSLKNKKQFVGFLFHLWNLHQISTIFKKKEDRHS